MADEELRSKERWAQAGGVEERAAWLVELRRSGAPEVLAAEAFQERARASLAELRGRVDRQFDSYRRQGVVEGCPELALEPVLNALEGALRPREESEGVGYGYEFLATFWPTKDVTYASQCGVMAFAARLGESVWVGVDFGSASKPSPGTVWSELSPWRESLKPATKERKLRAWAGAGEERSWFWERCSVEEARLWVDLYRLPHGELSTTAPVVEKKKGKATWEGVVVGVQPRLKLNRPYGEDEYFPAGYALRLEGRVDGEAREFSVGVGPKAQSRHGFVVGDEVSGVGLPVEDPSAVPVDFYRVSKLKLLSREEEPDLTTPPFRGPAPELEAYRSLTPRRLPSSALREDPCRGCHWGARVQVEGLPEFDEPLLPCCFGPEDCAAFVAP
jgi:hypothetical protein